MNVVILAQGNQSRLPELAYPKQLVALPDCGNVPILERTFRQLDMLIPNVHVNLVCSSALIERALSFRPSLSVSYVTLPEPGNSSLKGLHRYFLREPVAGYYGAVPAATTPTVVLLGDVIYSWRCLLEIFRMGPCPARFVGTANLSPGGGELWGCAWRPNAHSAMLMALGRAVQKHPPASVDDTYQPGQLRRLLWDVDENHAWMFGAGDNRSWFVPCDDYTMDIDEPKHLDAIKKGAGVSYAAAIDDREHNLVW